MQALRAVEKVTFFTWPDGIRASKPGFLLAFVCEYSFADIMLIISYANIRLFR